MTMRTRTTNRCGMPQSPLERAEKRMTALLRRLRICVRTAGIEASLRRALAELVGTLLRFEPLRVETDGGETIAERRVMVR